MPVRIALALCLSVSAAGAWPVAVGTPTPRALTIARGGDLLAAVPVRLRRGYETCEVASLERATGRVRWRHRIHGSARNHATQIGDLVATSDGDAVFVGQVQERRGASFVVARLAGRDGRERWRSDLRGQEHEGNDNLARAGVVDQAGDVIVAGTLQDRSTTVAGLAVDIGDFAVVKLDGSTGSERWRRVFPAPPGGGDGLGSPDSDADAVAVDGAGDVVAAGAFSGRPTVGVVKLDGQTGEARWRSDLGLAWRTSAIALDAAGDVFLAVSTSGASGNDFGVVKLSGGTGGVLWVHRESASDGRWEEAVRVLTDGSGNVFASGMVDDGTGSASGPDGYLFTVVRLDPATGAAVWRYRTTGTAGGGFATQLRLGAPGILIAGGSTRGAKTCEEVRVVALGTDDGALLSSRTFNGTYSGARFHCSSGGDGGGPGPPLDEDELGAIVADGDGNVFAGLQLTNRTSNGVRSFGSIRRLRRSAR